MKTGKKRQDNDNSPIVYPAEAGREGEAFSICLTRGFFIMKESDFPSLILPPPCDGYHKGGELVRAEDGSSALEKLPLRTIPQVLTNGTNSGKICFSDRN